MYFFNSGNLLIYAVFFLGAGVVFFFKGFKRLSEKRLIQDTPTSTVRGIALGLVELSGTAHEIKTIKSPISGRECVFFRCTVERYENSGRYGGKWVEIDGRSSDESPFYLDDGTGKIKIFPRGAEIIMPVRYQYQTGLGIPPDNISVFMKNSGLSSNEMFGNNSLRFKEWYIIPHENVCILGTAEQKNCLPEEQEEKLDKGIENIKKEVDPQKEAIWMAEVGLNKNGMGSKDVLKTEQKTSNEPMPDTQNDATELIIGKGDGNQTFVISDEIQSQMVKSMTWQSFAEVFGGALLSLASLAYILYELHIGINF
ncbi:MAG: E3 ubiquitin ligase family protein [Candidatus Omnitrophica bacterium]|nr:E3 ubiquitin ligase family protein [Candidatus Omnitrophota bacterium]